MKTNRISAILCLLVATVIGACSTDQPTGPAAGDSPLNRFSTTLDDPENPPKDDPNDVGGGTDPSGGGTVGEARPRPVEDFLVAQGTFCVDNGFGGCQLYDAPVSNYLAWFDQSRNMAIAIDYAGVAASWLQQHGRHLGSQVLGSVTEQAQGDGTSLYTVSLTGSNVLSFAVQGANLSSPEMAFGAHPRDLIDAARAPALGDITMEIQFIGATGAPLPDLIQLLRAPQAGQRLLKVTFKYVGTGTVGGDPSGDQNDVANKGQQMEMIVKFDGSMGEVMVSNPHDPANSPPTGFASVQMNPA